MEQTANLARPRRWPNWWRRTQIWARRANLITSLEIGSVAAFVLMTALTWYKFSTPAAAGKLMPTELTASLLVGTLVPAMAILMLLGRRLALKRAAERADGGRGQLHVRLVFLFSLISAVPTLLVVIFASFLFQTGVDFWFSDKSRGVVENANQLAIGYREQIERDLEYESLAMAADLGDFLSREPLSSSTFPEYYGYQIQQRKISESTILEKGKDGALHRAAFARGPEPLSEQVSADVLRQLDRGARIVVSSDGNAIQAVTPIDRRAGVYLFTARESELLSRGYTQNILRSYDELTLKARVQQFQFNVALFVASLALVGLSVWFALRFADRQVEPLYGLIDAAKEVGAGNFAMRIDGRAGTDEIGLLNRAFNRMTQQLDRQTQALVGANQQLDERRAFIEAVLESVTAGIISTDARGRIRLINGSAQKLLLDPDAASPIGMKLDSVSP